MPPANDPEREAYELLAWLELHRGATWGDLPARYRIWLPLLAKRGLVAGEHKVVCLPNPSGAFDITRPIPVPHVVCVPDLTAEGIVALRRWRLSHELPPAAREAESGRAAPRNGGGSRARKSPGRPRTSDLALDRRIAEAVAGGTPRKEVAREYAMPLEEVKRRADRHRKRAKRAGG